RARFHPGLRDLGRGAACFAVLGAWGEGAGSAARALLCLVRGHPRGGDPGAAAPHPDELQRGSRRSEAGGHHPAAGADHSARSERGCAGAGEGPGVAGGRVGVISSLLLGVMMSPVPAPPPLTWPAVALPPPVAESRPRPPTDLVAEDGTNLESDW